MPNPIKLRRSYTANSVPLVSDLEENECAINWTDGKIFVRRNNAIVTLTLGGGGGSGLTWSTVPASATASGTAGQIAYDGDYIYVATGSSAWKRAALSTWAPFTPTSVTGLQLWLDASDATTLYDATSGGSLVSADGSVARMEDKSGNNRHATQATSGLRPVRKTSSQNGLGAIEFTASSNQRMVVSGSASSLKFLHSSAYTLFAVFRAGSTSTPDVLNPLLSTIATFGDNPGMVIYHDDRSSIPRSNQIGVGVNNAVASIISYTTGDSFFVGGAFGLLTATGDMAAETAAGRSTLYKNGGNAVSASSTSGSPDTSSSQSDLTLGALANQFWLNGRIGEIVIYNSVLSSTDRDAVESYLMTKWGLS